MMNSDDAGDSDDAGSPERVTGWCWSQAVCCCVWLVPLRLYTDLVNTACLARAARNMGGNLLLSVFLSRELVRAAVSLGMFWGLERK